MRVIPLRVLGATWANFGPLNRVGNHSSPTLTWFRLSRWLRAHSASISARYTGLMIHDRRGRELRFCRTLAVARLRADDAKLGALIDRVGAFTLRFDLRTSLFAWLVESILDQLLCREAATIHRRVRACIDGNRTPALMPNASDRVQLAALFSGIMCALKRSGTEVAQAING